MLAKWTTFEVAPSERGAFDAAGTGLSELARARGFIAQAGGWLDGGRTRAGVLSFWTDIYRYQAFMRRQPGVSAARTYASGRMALAKQVMRIEGEHSQLRQAAALARSLRVSDCTLDRAQMAAFLDEQRGALGRTAFAHGFLAGSLLRVQDDEPRFLVASFWDGDVFDADSLSATLPSYRSGAATQTASARIASHRIRLVDAWRVVAE